MGHHDCRIHEGCRGFSLGLIRKFAQYHCVAISYQRWFWGVILHIIEEYGSVKAMKKLAIYLFALMLFALPAHAGCFADYKAKAEPPLQLHYGVIALDGPCSRESAQAEISRRIAKDGWSLLKVISLFDKAQARQKAPSAGEYFLKY